MPRDAGFIEQTNGSALEAFLLLRQEGRNIPPAWIDRSGESRKRREKALGKNLRQKSLDSIYLLRDWEIAYRKECFYFGIRALMELERSGKRSCSSNEAQPCVVPGPVQPLMKHDACGLSAPTPR